MKSNGVVGISTDRHLWTRGVELDDDFLVRRIAVDDSSHSETSFTDESSARSLARKGPTLSSDRRVRFEGSVPRCARKSDRFERAHLSPRI
ncbi:MAG: hypothetical protein AUK47_17210 [Deltaproteobacteria bacterium CG2_30_63_29]|nr:MAG: hypothetical protein AUK47_17210 [Deltaproteobacteria bacterium CG2_30_63_29]